MKTAGPVILGFFLAVVTGCGVYSFSGAGKAPFETLTVSPFANNTIEYELGDRLTDAVVDAFIRENLVKIVEPARAEAVMDGTVASYRRDPYTYDQQDNVSQYAVKVSVKVKVVKPESEDIIWEKDFYAEGVYDANTETEEDGQTRAVTLLTADIVNNTTNSW
jgi:outer membrane lipopolysaccharide assembly protein LptE/RlpB